MPILCGGTGLYLRTLTQGIADIPDPGEAARVEARGLLADEGPAALHTRLLAADPETAAALRPSDGQRLARAWEVWRGTGRGMSHWQRRSPPPSGWSFAVILLDPPRPALRAAIAARFAAMLEQGAVEEVAALLQQKLDPALPAMRAHGVPELAGFLQGKMLLSEAQLRATLATGQYTKRQATWFRHQRLVPPGRSVTINARYGVSEQFSERWMADMQSFLNRSD